MARQTPSKTNSSKSRAIPREKSISELVRDNVSAKIERARARRTAEAKARRDGNRIPPGARRAIPGKGKSQLDAMRELQAHGFRTAPAVKGKGFNVIIDGPRNKRREQIKGSRVSVLKGGVIKTSVGARRDFIYGFTKKEKKEFAKDPEAFTKKKMSELERIFPSLRQTKKKQVRLQWGAYEATKDFAPTHWLKMGSGQYFNAQTPEMKRKKATGKLRDRLTGLHIVIHIPKRSKAHNRVRENGKGKKRR